MHAIVIGSLWCATLSSISLTGSAKKDVEAATVTAVEDVAVAVAATGTGEGEDVAKAAIGRAGSVATAATAATMEELAD